MVVVVRVIRIVVIIGVRVVRSGVVIVLVIIGVVVVVVVWGVKWGSSVRVGMFVVGLYRFWRKWWGSLRFFVVDWD